MGFIVFILIIWLVGGMLVNPASSGFINVLLFIALLCMIWQIEKRKGVK